MESMELMEWRVQRDLSEYRESKESLVLMELRVSKESSESNDLSEK